MQRYIAKNIDDYLPVIRQHYPALSVEHIINVLDKSKNKTYWRLLKYAFFLQNKHKFAITFENNSYPGYVTEKLMDGFLGCSIPIYWGAKNIGEEFNEKSFINAMNYSNKDLMEFIKYLDNNDDAFNKMYNEPIFTDEQKEKHLTNIENFESWFINKIKE